MTTRTLTRQSNPNAKKLKQRPKWSKPRLRSKSKPMARWKRSSRRKCRIPIRTRHDENATNFVNAVNYSHSHLNSQHHHHHHDQYYIKQARCQHIVNKCAYFISTLFFLSVNKHFHFLFFRLFYNWPRYKFPLFLISMCTKFTFVLSHTHTHTPCT